jgi:YVTN family beta-propeller protein
MSRTIALMLALAVVTAGVLAAGSSGAREPQRTIGPTTQQGEAGFSRGVKTDPSAVAVLTPCAKLKKRRRPLPVRCRKPRTGHPASLPSLGTVVATIPIAGESHELGDMTFGAGSLWVLDHLGVARIDPATDTVIARIPGPAWDYGSVIVAGGAVFVAHFNSNSVTRIDPATNSIVATIPLGAYASPEGLASTPGSLWVADHYGQAVSRIDIATNTVVATIPIGKKPPGACCGPQEITVGAGSVWTGVPNSASVVRIDPNTNTVTANIPVGTGVCGDLAADDTAVWVTNSGCGGRAITRIDPATNAIVPTAEPMGQATGVAIVGGAVYFGADYGDADSMPGLYRMDGGSNKATGYLALPGFSTTGDNGHTNVVDAAGSLWVRGFGEVVRIQATG